MSHGRTTCSMSLTMLWTFPSSDHGTSDRLAAGICNCTCNYWSINALAQAANVVVFTVLTHTHTRLTAFFPGLPGWAGTRKVKPVWILLKQETVSGSGISWTICKSAPGSRQITMPAPHRSVFLQAGCPSCHPTNSVKALKASIYSAKSRHNEAKRVPSHLSCQCTKLEIWK